MNSQQISTIAMEPFIQEFVYAIVQNIRAKNFNYKEKQVIHADLVPKFSSNIIEASLGENKVMNINNNLQLDTKRIIPRPINPNLNIIKPLTPASTIQPKIPTQPIIQSPQITSPSPIVPSQPIAPIAPQMAPPMAPEGTQVGPAQYYNKINLLLNDPSVSMIECQGTGKPIMVMRGGQRQITRIILTAEDIKNILDRVSDQAHIPLLEGVFRAAVDNFAINATISDIIGSKFIIRKQPNYIMPKR